MTNNSCFCLGFGFGFDFDFGFLTQCKRVATVLILESENINIRSLS